jgi:predicted nucleic acid-binding protein
MSSDLVPRVGAVVRANSREIRTLQKQTTLVVAHEDAEALVREVRIRNAYQLAHHTVDRAAILNRVVMELSHDNPGLEMMLRAIEREVGLQAGDLIADYLRR